MKEKRINTAIEFDFRLIGIATSLKEYRLCFFLNRILDCDFVKQKDQVLETKDRTRSYSFGVNKGECRNNRNRFFVFSNKNAGEFLIGELDDFDYLLMAKGEVDAQELKHWISAIREMDGVLVCTDIPLSRVKNKNRLIYQEERPVTKLYKSKNIL